MKKTIFALGFAVMLLILSFQTDWAVSSNDLLGLTRTGGITGPGSLTLDGGDAGGITGTGGLGVDDTVDDGLGTTVDPADMPEEDPPPPPEPEPDPCVAEDAICGLVEGVSVDRFVSGEGLFSGGIDFDSVVDEDQGCIGPNYAFYEDEVQSSTAFHPVLKLIDFTWSVNSANHVSLDENGYWQGFAKLPRIAGAGNKWLWFDWTCDECTEVDYENRVHTDLTTGEVSGYAWSDFLASTTGIGYVSFDGLTQKLLPMQVEPQIEILSLDGLSPGEVTIDTAPYADGYQWWRVKVQFHDFTSGRYLNESEVSMDYLNINATLDSKVLLNQVINSSASAILQTATNPNIPGCESDGIAYCVMTEEDGTKSFNTFVRSGTPTSNMTGIDDDSDETLDYYTDRDGCVYIYPDSYSPSAPRPACSGAFPDKADVFNSRSVDRNKYAIDSVDIVNLSINAECGASIEETYVTFDSNAYVYDPSEDVELSFRPRYQVKNISAKYNGAEYLDFPDDQVTPMKLKVDAFVDSLSAEYLSGGGGSVANRFDIFYQMDVDSEPVHTSFGDLHLLIDTNATPDGVADDTRRVENYGTGSLVGDYNVEYVMSYGQKEKECGGGGLCEPPSNTVSNPTVEQWVCDYVAESLFTDPSCYYTAYLPLPDRHFNPAAGLMLSGTANSNIDENGVYLNPADEDVSILGALDFASYRDKLYARALRYVMGQSAGGGTLNSHMMPTAPSNIVSLLSGTVLYANGDVHILGSDAFFDKTLIVVDGNIYIHGNIENAKFGIVAFSTGAVTPNIFVYPEVTHIEANIFTEGTLTSYSGVIDTDTGLSVWSSEDDRLDALKNQLCLTGSLMSINTVGGSEVVCDAGGYPIGNGTCVLDQDLAQEYDLVKLRQLRQCYALDGSGAIEPCNEGEQLSSCLDPDTGDQTYDASMIIESSPAGDLPVFVDMGR
jgi:hypothetical protein